MKETVMDDILSHYFNKDVWAGALASFLFSLLAARFKTKIWTFLKNKRVWPRTVSIVIVAIIAVKFLDEKTIEMYPAYMLVGVILIALTIWTAFLPLPHEYYIIEHMSEKSQYMIWTTSGKIRNEYKHIQKSNKKDRQRLYCEFVEFLDTKDLFYWEVEDYYFTTLDNLLRMGAINRVEKGLNRYQKTFGHTTNWNLLKSYVSYFTLDLSQMESILIDLENRNDVERQDLLIMRLNIICAANESSDKDTYNKYIKIIEKSFLEEDLYNEISLADLMYYYDERDEEKKALRIIRKIETTEFINLSKFLAYYDILFQHYRKIENYEKETEIARFIIERGNELAENEEEKLLFQIRSLTLMFDINAWWMEYSIRIFSQHDYFLNYSFEVAINYISEVLKTLRNAQNIYKLNLPEVAYKDLSNAILKAIDLWKPKLEELIATTHREYLYKRKDLYMHLVDMFSFLLDKDRTLNSMEKDKIQTIDNIISDCEYNGNIREKLHFINVYCDEILTVHEQVYNSRNMLNLTEFTKYDSWFNDYLKPCALEKLGIIESIIKDNINNKSLNYYVLYTSYLYGLCGNTKKQQFYFRLFEDYEIDPHYFNSATQKLYVDLKKQVLPNK